MKQNIYSFLCACLLTISIQGCATRVDINDTHQAVQKNNQADDFIGFAKMEADGTLILQLNAVSDDGKIRGHGYFRYPPDHPEYKEVLEHIRPMKPGEEKLVLPWPDKK